MAILHFSMVVSENKKMQKGRPPLYYSTSPPPPFLYFREVNVSVPKWNMESSVCNQFYSISYHFYSKNQNVLGLFYLRYKEDYLASEIDCKKNLRQRTQVLIRRRNSNEVASVLCFSMLVNWKALQ